MPLPKWARPSDKGRTNQSQPWPARFDPHSSPDCDGPQRGRGDSPSVALPSDSAANGCHRDDIQTQALTYYQRSLGPDKADSGLRPAARPPEPRVPSERAYGAVPAFTLGRGLKGNPTAQRIPLGEDPLETVRHHLANHDGYEAWGSGHVWSDDRRSKKRWQSAAGAWVDLDFTGHAPLPTELGHAALEALEGVANLAHLTPHGVRVIFLFPEVLTEREQFDSAARGAIELTEQALREAGVSGLETDFGATCDLARAFLAPNATARCKKKHAECAGGKRSADVVVLRRELWSAEDLSALAPAKAARTKKRTKNVLQPQRSDGAVVETGDAMLSILIAEGWEWKSGELCFRCPLPGHEDQHPSAQYNAENHTWYCFVCGQGAGWMDLAELRGMQPAPRIAKRESRSVRERGLKRPEVVFKKDLDDVPLHILRPRGEREIAVWFEGEIFQRGGELVEVVRKQRLQFSDAWLQPRLAIVSIAQPVLKEKLDAAARWVCVRVIDGVERRNERLAPTSLVKALHELHSWDHIPEITGVLEAPTMRPDGSLIEQRGFDAATGFYYEPRYEYPAIPLEPNEAQVCEAVKALLAPFSEFEFVSSADQASLLSLMLTMATRPAIQGPTPHFAISSPTFGTGKTLLVKAVTSAMTGATAEFFPPPAGRLSDAESEMRKRITAALLDAPRVAVIDNIPDGMMFESAVFANLLTSPAWTDRVLGKPGKVTLPNSVVWVSSGVNFSLKGDLVRRSLSIRIDPGVEHPESRKFEIDNLAAYCHKHHPRLLRDALVVMRGYLVAGEPPHGKGPIGGFEAWDARVRGAVVWATRLVGEALDPQDTQDRLKTASPERTGHVELAAAWYGVFGNEAVQAKDVVRRASSRTPLLEALDASGCVKDGKVNARRLGNHLRTIQDRIVGGFVFRSAGTRQNATCWRVEQQSPRESGESGESDAAPLKRSHGDPPPSLPGTLRGGTADSPDSPDSPTEGVRTCNEPARDCKSPSAPSEVEPPHPAPGDLGADFKTGEDTEGSAA
jgi:hypothetical protein